MSHCAKCGDRMVQVARPTGKHDSFTGAPTQNEWFVCPQWRSRWLVGNGHDWRHQGENPIDGVMPYGADPMTHENPPRPPRVPA